MNQRGDITLLSNSVYGCGPGAACSTALAETGGTATNNGFTMVPVDTDGDPSTTISSTADLALPAGATVTWAGLYWSCNSTNAARNKVLLRAPGEAYEEVTATVLNFGGYESDTYQGFAEVTDLLRGDGTYAVGGLQCVSSDNKAGGWTIVIAYADSTQPLRNLVVYDGYQRYGAGAAMTTTVNLSGFLTPPAGDVASRIGIVAYDGDRGQSDTLAMVATNGVDTVTTSLGDPPLNPTGDIGNSTITRFGGAVPTRNPAYNNTLGYDSDLIATTNALPNSATTATITATGGSLEGMVLGVITFATDIYAPDLKLTKSAALTDTDGNGADFDDILTYTVVATNAGKDGSTVSVLTDDIPAGTSYVPGSLRLGGALLTDAAGDDVGRYDAAQNRVVVHLGTGANGSVGGAMAPNATATITFQVRITTTAGGQPIRNTANASYGGETVPGSTYASDSDGDSTTPGQQPTEIITAAVCGDNTITDPETCDVGDNTAGDGCSAICRIEVAITGPTSGTTSTDATPTFTGTAEPGASVSVTTMIDGFSFTIGTTTADASGSWTLTPALPLPDGSRSYVATATNTGSGGTSTDSTTFTIDATAHVTVVSPGGGTIPSNNTTPTLTGTADPGATVEVFIDGTSVGTTTATGSGTWSLPLTDPLGHGSHTIRAEATDPNGNIAPSATGAVLIDILPPTISITGPVGTVTTKTPAVTGVAEPGASVAVVVDGVLIGTVTADPTTGAWSVPTTTPLSDGTHSVGATATDAAGNTASAAGSFTVDATASVSIITPANGSTTNDDTPTFSGTADPGSSVTLSLDGNPYATVTADADGDWSYTPTTPLAEQTYALTVGATDPSGNVAPSAQSSFTIDTTAPALTIESPAQGSTTNDATPTVTGTSDPNATVTLTIDGGAPVTVTADGSGAWSYQVPSALSEDDHTVSATTEDEHGNSVTVTNDFTVDLSDPAITITGPADGSVIASATPVITGTTDPGASVEIFVDGASVGTTTADATTGAWSFPTTDVLADGTHEVRAVATDAGGNTAETTNDFSVDTKANVTVVSPADGGTTTESAPIVSGTADPGSTLVIYLDGDPTPVGTTTADAEGNWTFPLDELEDGPHTLVVDVTDPLGNEGTTSGGFTVDSTAPDLEILAPGKGSTTNNTTPTVSGSADPGAVVSVSIDGTPVGTATADATGHWSLELTDPLSEDVHEVVATTSDDVGNTATDTSEFTVDLTAPTVAIEDPADGSVIAEATPTISGTSEPGAEIEVFVDGALVGTTTTDVNGDWSLPTTTVLDDGLHTVRVTATDAGGNTATASSAFTVDTTTTVTITGPADGAVIGGPRPSISGTAEPGAQVEVFLDGGSIGTVTAGVDGSWSLTPPADLVDGPHTVVAEARDALGNTADAHSDFTLDPSLRDSDGDGLDDSVECPDEPCRDSDDDGTPDYLDPDDDGDGIPTIEEAPGGTPRDTDEDGQPDHLDPDDDGDTIPTKEEAPGGTPRDTDGDGKADHLDPDDDGDTIPTAQEKADGAEHGDDVDGDGKPNWLDTDADGDGLSDGDEGLGDEDGDGVPNYLDPKTEEPGLDGGVDGGVSAGGVAGGACGCSVPGGAGSTPSGALLGGFGLLGLLLLRRRKLGATAATLLVLLLALPTGASAQGFQLDGFRAAETSRDGFALSSPEDLGHLGFSARLTLDYALRPLVFEGISGDSSTERTALVEHLLVGNASFAMGFFDRLVVFAGLPATLYSAGDSDGGLPAADGSRVGDAYLGARARIYGERDDLFALGAQLTVTAPLGNAVRPSQNYSGERAFTFAPELAAELRFFERRLRVLANVGARLRNDTPISNLRVGHELTFGVGAIGEVVPKYVDVLLELYGSTAFQKQPHGDRPFFGRETSPAEVIAGVRVHPTCNWEIGLAGGTGITRGYGAPDFRGMLQVGYSRDEAQCAAPAASEPEPEAPIGPVDTDGDQLIDDADACPNEPEDTDGFDDADGCPDPDNDGDGVLDVDDGAPNDPEDADGFQDEDGVPDPDNDGDGILDVNDGAPNEPEDTDGFQDEDGVPDLDNDGDGIPDTDDLCPVAPGLVEDQGCPRSVRYDAERGTILILQRVEFATGRDTILAQSYPLLTEVRGVLAANPHLRLVLVEGHTDSRGRDASNMELSKKRAASVARWLIDNGIDAARLTPSGCGELAPIDSNKTNAGRQANRRVEFIIVDPAPADAAERAAGCQSVEL